MNAIKQEDQGKNTNNDISEEKPNEDNNHNKLFRFGEKTLRESSEQNVNRVIESQYINSDKNQLPFSENKIEKQIRQIKNNDCDLYLEGKEITERTGDQELELIRNNSPFPNIAALNSEFKKEKKTEFEEEKNKNLIEIDSKMTDSFEAKNSKQINSSNILEIKKYNSNLSNEDKINSYCFFALVKQTSTESISDDNEYYLVEKILRFVETKKPLNHVLCGYFYQIFNNLSKLKISQVNF